MVASDAVHLQHAVNEAVGAMSWDELDAKYGAKPGGAQSWDALDASFSVPKTAPHKQKADPVTDFSGTLRFGPFDTGINLPEGVNRRLAQLGSGMADWSTRVDQLLGKASEQDVADKRKLDSLLRNDSIGKALGVAGQALPSLAIPAAAGAPVVSGALAGGLTGFMQPVGPSESATANTALGTALGAAIPAAGKALLWAAKPSADMAATAAKAEKYGIPVGAADMSSNGMVKGARSFTNDLPIVGIPGQMLKAKQEDALTRAVGDTFGAPFARLTPEVMDAAKKRMGAEFDRLWGNNNLVVDGQMFAAMQNLRQAAQSLPAGQRANVISKIDDLWSRSAPGAGGAPTIPGQTANEFQQFLREQAKPNSALEYEFSTLRRAIIDGFNRSISPADAAALTLNRSQYKAYKTVEPLLDKGVVGTAGRAEGVVPSALLPEAVRRSYSGLSSQTTTPALAELAQVSGRLLADRTPQTGGSARAMLQNMGIGAGLTASSSVAPMTTALGVAGGAALNAALNSPRLAKALTGQKAQRGLLSVSPEELAAELLLLTGSRAPIALPGLLTPSE